MYKYQNTLTFDTWIEREQTLEYGISVFSYHAQHIMSNLSITRMSHVSSHLNIFITMKLPVSA